MTGLKYGVVYHTGFFGIAPEQVTAVARHAEECGFESFFTTEHIALYPGVKLGRTPIAPDTPYQASTLPIHVGGSSEAAARRAGLRGDGYFPGGGINDEQRAAQVALMRETARAAGRDGDALEYTRWGNIAMTPDDVAPLAAEGVTRLIISPTTGDLAGQRDELSAFAERHGLG